MNVTNKKVVIVTGASSGIGKETVLRLLKAGYEVHTAARRLDAMRDLEQQGAHLHYLDLTKAESIDTFVAEVLKQSGRIDVLVNNAGDGSYGAVEAVPQLLTIAAAAESLAGLALILAPEAAVVFLLGAEPNVAGVKLGRVCGVALMALGIACWGARTDSGSAARSGTLKAITFYNAGVGLLLVLFAAIGKTGGIVLWSVGVFHLALAAAFTISFRRPKDTSSTKFGT